MKRIEQIVVIFIAAALAIPSYWFFWTLAGGGGYNKRIKPMKNSRKLDSPKRPIIEKKKKRLVNSDSHDNANSDVLVSAVISPYLLTHLHHILQQSEYYAQKDGRKSHAANFAKLRKVLCLDARSMADASAKEIKDVDNDLSNNKYNEQNVA